MNFFFIRQNLFWLLPFVLLDIILKLYALWRAGRNNQPYWFVALSLINSLGILPLIYLIFFQKKAFSKK
ncbi:hypothetical protein A3D77_04095 [Candidatus Gottesmanbacteria bacterium RIFCSPHIGHO2_02_FULL_39_11]|uniref:DUF5652 domain-containing protein n=1 Tax=Candidatus Gottesmanbacteria bacterium RIFCSPHIGHO2_02_FULL_39_11 TaxID=1798382 RepID=A0A1F5ZJL9_9BACT|nr:MAG: hypothetical protein A3D77_04095 [Candidatus Gottesmanbacteria bacterium RIFCSPHIGHO2_02_FULL_39_11]